MSRLPVLALAAVLGACQPDPFTVPDIPDPPIGDGKLQMSARIDGRTYLATDPTGFSIQHIEVNKGGIRLSATFRSGTAGSPAVNPVDYRLTVSGSETGEPLPERVVFSPSRPFEGSLYWIAPGQAVELWIGLYHGPTGRYVFGPFPITLERRSHDTDTDEPGADA
jgi:hypothetical protein